MRVKYTVQQREQNKVHKFHDCKHDERSRNGSWVMVCGLGIGWSGGYYKSSTMPKKASEAGEVKDSLLI